MKGNSLAIHILRQLSTFRSTSHDKTGGPYRQAAFGNGRGLGGTLPIIRKGLSCRGARVNIYKK
jgi:hypothetical protein